MKDECLICGAPLRYESKIDKSLSKFVDFERVAQIRSPLDF